MRDLSAAEHFVDNLDALLDAALADPARAPRLRAAMRARLAAPESDAAPADDNADAEDLWDNVPL